MFIKPGSILLCISDLPAGVTTKELKAFVLGGIDNRSRRSLRMSPAVPSCIILRVTNTDTGAISHEGLVAVQPARLALDLIKALRRQPLRNTSVRVCRYRHSSFEVGIAGETKSIGDLLGINDADRLADAPRCKLELVGHTGSPCRPSAHQTLSLPANTPPANAPAAPSVNQAKVQRTGKAQPQPRAQPSEAEQQPGTDGAFAH